MKAVIINMNIRSAASKDGLDIAVSKYCLNTCEIITHIHRTTNTVEKSLSRRTRESERCINRSCKSTNASESRRVIQIQLSVPLQTLE